MPTVQAITVCFISLGGLNLTILHVSKKTSDIDRTASPAFIADCSAAFAGAHPGPETALT
jgi:hypothetical protein